MTMPPGRAKREPTPAPTTPDDRDGRGAGARGPGVQRFDGRSNMAAGGRDPESNPWNEQDTTARVIHWKRTT